MTTQMHNISSHIYILRDTGASAYIFIDRNLISCKNYVCTCNMYEAKKYIFLRQIKLSHIKKKF